MRFRRLAEEKAELAAEVERLVTENEKLRFRLENANERLQMYAVAIKRVEPAPAPPASFAWREPPPRLRPVRKKARPKR